MFCQNCGENEANVRYTQVINGVKKEMFLCDRCSKALGIGNFDFSMPINLSSFLGEFLDAGANLLPSFANPKTLNCKECGTTYDEFIQTGRLGCENCFNIFSDNLDNILKNIQGGNRHIGKIGNKVGKQEKIEVNESIKENNVEENTKIEELKQKMKEAIKEERYEDAAKIRDEIKKLENEK